MGRYTGDSGGEDHATRARQVAEASSHDGVTAELLGGTGRYSTTFYLYDQPAVAYLETDEHVHFGFYNEMKGVGVGGPTDTYSPDNGGISIVLVTDRRVLALVGREDGDHELSMHYDTVTDASMETDGLHDRLIVETVSDTYHCWINTRCCDEDLEQAVATIHDRMADPHHLLGGGSDGEDGEHSGVASDGGSHPGRVPDATPDAGDRETADAADDDPLERIEKLHSLREAGAITEAEYQHKKSELLDEV